MQVRLGNFVECVGDGASEFLYTFAGGGGDGVKFEITLAAEFAEFFEMRFIGGSVELGGDDD